MRTVFIVLTYFLTVCLRIPVSIPQSRFCAYFIMRPSSLGGGRIMRRTLSVRLSVRPSRYRYRASRRAT